MDAATSAVLAANHSFYTALSLADFDLMARVWLDSADAVCEHPGWPPLQGWPAIGDSWREIFKGQGPLRVWATEAQVRLYGRTAEVNCVENIDMGQVRGTGILRTRAVNIFRQEAGAWKLQAHHAVSISSGALQRPERFSSN